VEFHTKFRPDRFSQTNRQTDKQSIYIDCIVSGAATGSFSSPVGSMYVRKHFKEEAKQSMEEMVRDIRTEFDNILDNIDWMDEKTRERAKVTKRNEVSLFN